MCSPFSCPTEARKAGTTIIPIVQIKRLRHGEVTYLSKVTGSLVLEAGMNLVVCLGSLQRPSSLRVEAVTNYEKAQLLKNLVGLVLF